jgi:Holliday junction resolvase RusA-like endonuclease
VNDTIRCISFDVPGQPKSQGSKRIGEHGQMFEQGGHELAAWRKTIAQLAMLHRRGRTIDAAVTVRLSFRVRYVGKSWPPKQRWDVDKLARAVLDGIVSGGLLADDALVVELHVTKHPVPSDPGVAVFVSEEAA